MTSHELHVTLTGGNLLEGQSFSSPPSQRHAHAVKELRRRGKKTYKHGQAIYTRKSPNLLFGVKLLVRWQVLSEAKGPLGAGNYGHLGNQKTNTAKNSSSTTYLRSVSKATNRELKIASLDPIFRSMSAGCVLTDLHDRIGVFQEPADQDVACLVVRHHLPLLWGHQVAPLLHTWGGRRGGGRGGRG